jgi:hypothetical protein
VVHRPPGFYYIFAVTDASDVYECILAVETHFVKPNTTFVCRVQSETIIAIILIKCIISIIFYVITAIIDIIYGNKNNEYNRNEKI